MKNKKFSKIDEISKLKGVCLNIKGLDKKNIDVEIVVVVGFFGIPVFVIG